MQLLLVCAVAKLVAGTPIPEDPKAPPLRPSEKGARGILYLGNGAPKYLGDIAATYKVPVLELPPSMDSAEQLNAFLNAVQENAQPMMPNTSGLKPGSVRQVRRPTRVYRPLSRT